MLRSRVVGYPIPPHSPSMRVVASLTSRAVGVHRCDQASFSGGPQASSTPWASADDQEAFVMLLPISSAAGT